MNPYDADAALESIRPRLIAAKARRRRVASASAGLALFAVSSVAAAAVLTTSGDPETTVVAVSPDDQREPDPTTTTTTTTEPLETDSHAGDSEDEGAGGDTDKVAPPDPDPTTTKPPPPPPPPTTKVTTTTTQPPPPPPQTVNHTFTYPGTGSVTVAQTGNSLAYVSSSAEGGWSHKLTHDSTELIGVEFNKDNVQRWLKVKIANGEVVAQQHEHVKCVPPASTSTHAAPNGAGTIDVSVDSHGKVTLAGVNAAEGWGHQVLIDEYDRVKVGFNKPGEHGVWVIAKIHDCALVTESG